MNWLRPLTVATLLTVLGCTTGQPSGTTPASPDPSASWAPGSSASALEGDARFPAEMAAGGQVIPTGIGSYRVQQADAELPVPGATVTARDLVSRSPLPLPATRTDAQGRFRLEGVQPGENHLVEVAFRAADGSRSFRLLALGRIGEPVSVSWRSTAVVTALLANPGTKDLRHLDLAPLRAAESAQATAYQALSPEAQKTFLSGLLTVTTETTTEALPLPSVAPLPLASALPSILPSLLPSSLPSSGLTTSVVQTTGSLASAVPSLGPVSTVASTLPSALPSLGTSTPTPSATSGLVETVVDTVEETTEILPLPTPSIKLPLL